MAAHSLRLEAEQLYSFRVGRPNRKFWSKCAGQIKTRLSGTLCTFGTEFASAASHSLALSPD